VEVRDFIVYLQARISSTRLPGKVLFDINGIPMIKRQIDRIWQSREINGLVVLIPDSSEDDGLHAELIKFGVDVFRGSENDVLQRFMDALSKFPARNIIRLTADCPLVMPGILDEMIVRFSKGTPDYLSNTLAETYPDGLDVEIFSASSIRKLSSLNLGSLEREHVTLGIYNRPEMFRLENFESLVDLSNQRWTVDYPDDFEFVKGVFKHYEGIESTFTISDVLRYIEIDPILHSNRTSSTLRHISLTSPNDREANLQGSDGV
jgi:spore coat polysaccharide biosynthesis protein SpsF